MNRILIALVLASAGASAQQAPLPSYAAGIGASWARGAQHPMNIDTTVGLQLGSTNWYSWTTISTPVARTRAGGTPAPATISTGGAFIGARSASGSVSLLLTVQGGFASGATATVPTFSGNMGVAFRLGKSNLYLIPYMKAESTTVIQPGFLLMYGFGK